MVLNVFVEMHASVTNVLATSAGTGVPPRFTRCKIAGISWSRLIANGRDAINCSALTDAMSDRSITTRITVSPVGPNSRVAAVAATNGSPAMSCMGTTRRKAALSDR